MLKNHACIDEKFSGELRRGGILHTRLQILSNPVKFASIEWADGKISYFRYFGSAF